MFKVPWDEINKTVEDATARTFDSIFSSLDGLEAEVQGLMDKDLEVYRDKIAAQIIDSAAARTAVIGGGAALPDLLPVAGWSTFVAAVGADFALTLREDLSMLLKMAFLYGQDVSREDRKRQAVSLLAAVGTRGGGDGSATGEMSKLMGMIGTKHVSRKVLVSIGKRLGERFFKRKLVKLIPGIGILLSGGVNYYSTRALGEYAQDYFAQVGTGKDRAGGISNEMRHFQETYLAILSTMAKRDGRVGDPEVEAIEDSMLMFGFAGPERDAVLRDLRDLEKDQDPDAAACRRLSEQDRSFMLKQAVAMMLADGDATEEQRAYLEELRVRFDVTPSMLAEIEREVRSELG